MSSLHDSPGPRDAPEPFPIVGPFVSARDPVNGNPFPVSDRWHTVWADATRKAADEVSRLTASARLPDPPGREWSAALIVAQFNAWAQRGASVLGSDRAFHHYDQWLRVYVQVCVNNVAQRFLSVPAADSDGVTIQDLRERLDAAAIEWSAAGRRVCLAHQSAHQGLPPDAAWARFVERFLEDNPFPADHPVHAQWRDVSQRLARELALIESTFWSAPGAMDEGKRIVERLAGWTEKYFDVLAQARLIVVVTDQGEDGLDAYSGELDALQLQALRAADDLHTRVTAHVQTLMTAFPGLTARNETSTALLAALNQRLLADVTRATDARKSTRWIQACMMVRNPDHFPSRASRTAPEPVRATEAAAADGRRPTSPSGWEAVEIRFLSDLKFQAVVGGTVQEPKNYADVGFGDRRGPDMPRAAWDTLRHLAESHGVLSSADTAAKWGRVEKHMQEIRKRLRAHFKIPGDPVPYREGAYRARFTIGVRGAYDR